MEPMAESAIAVPATYLAELRRELEKEWPDHRRVKIVCHGHSVPAGFFDTPRVDSVNAYPHRLFVKLTERYPNALLNVIVTAFGGEHAVLGAERFERDVLSLRPDVVTIDYALNDRGLGLEAARVGLGGDGDRGPGSGDQGGTAHADPGSECSPG